jgi:hypothetical protein
VADPILGAMKSRVRGIADLAWLSGCARDRSCLLCLGTGSIGFGEVMIMPRCEWRVMSGE